MCDVLVLDDDPATCELIADLLVEEGLKVEEAHTPERALAILRDPPGARLLVAEKDLCATDEIDGFATAAEALRLYPSLRVVYMSSEALTCSRETPRERSLPRPFIPNELIEVVQDLLVD
jgi:CheY-like chemotaxis protein